MKICISLSSKFIKGQNVAVRLDDDVWYCGQISKVSRDGSYSILFNDGDTGKILDNTLIKSIDKVGKKGSYTNDGVAKLINLKSKSAYKCNESLKETHIKSRSTKLLQSWIISGTKWKDDLEDRTTEPESVTFALTMRIQDFGSAGHYAKYTSMLYNYEIRNVSLKSIKPIHQDYTDEDASQFTANELKKDFEHVYRKHDVLPILLSYDGSILDGYHRFRAAQINKEKTIPALVSVCKDKILNIIDFANYGEAS